MKRATSIIREFENSPNASEFVLAHAAESGLGLDLLVTVTFRDLVIDVLGDKAPAVALIGLGEATRGNRMRIDRLVELGLMRTRLSPGDLQSYPSSDNTEALTIELLRDLVSQLPEVYALLCEPSEFLRYSELIRNRP